MDWEIVGNVALLGLAIFVFIMIIFAPILGLYAYQNYQICQILTDSDETHRYQWTLWTGCLVRTSEGYWVHYSDAGIIHLTQEE